MNIEIVAKSFEIDIYGFSSVATNNDYVETAFKLSSKMWQTIKANGIKNKGMNIWVYEDAHKVFAGVELADNSENNNYELEKKSVTLEKYAYYKHIGSYNLIKQIAQKMRSELAKQGFNIILPYVEIYGHWTNDESKLETELLMCLK